MHSGTTSLHVDEAATDIPIDLCDGGIRAVGACEKDIEHNHVQVIDPHGRSRSTSSDNGELSSNPRHSLI